MNSYYNENDLYAAQWLRNLIAAGHIAPGEVDERSIVDVRADDLRGFRQCHFFAGIGVWSHALRLAGWPDDRPVWTGSCPCQPFSAAGKGEGTDDARHLWPHWFRLIREHRPVAIFGEQVAAAIRHSWLDLVCADLEGLDYAVGAAVLGAHSVGAPHIRQRLYFVADAQRRTAERRGYDVHGAPRDPEGEARQRERLRAELGTGSDARELAYAECNRGHDRRRTSEERAGDPNWTEATERGSVFAEVEGLRSAGELGDAASSGRSGERGEGQERTSEPSATGQRLEHPESDGREQRGTESSGRGAESRCGSFWSNADWLPCIDGKARPVEPGIFPLVNGYPNRVGILRAAGNAIVPQAAAEFIRAYIEA